MKCEEIRMAAMALAEGEKPPIPPGEVQAHLAVCAECRGELAELAALCQRLDGQQRRNWAPDLWGRIEGRIARPSPNALWFGVLLLGCFELLELVPDRQLSMLLELTPVLIALAIFGWLRQNPFRINTELRLEEEEL